VFWEVAQGSRVKAKTLFSLRNRSSGVSHSWEAEEKSAFEIGIFIVSHVVCLLQIHPAQNVCVLKQQSVLVSNSCKLDRFSI